MKYPAVPNRKAIVMKLYDIYVTYNYREEALEDSDLNAEQLVEMINIRTDPAQALSQGVKEIRIEVKWC